MKRLHTEVSRLTDRLLQIQAIKDPNLLCPFHSQPEYHSHPEVELLYVISGKGKRIVNGVEAPFESGDMVFMGPGVPHIWITDGQEDKSENSPKAILLYFNIFKFQELFNSIPEFSDIRRLINEGRRGIQVTGATRDQVGKMLLEVHEQEGFPQLESILRVLHVLSVSDDKQFISEETQAPQGGEVVDRMVPVLKYIHENLHLSITLEELSSIAGMTENAFCRWFRSRMKQTFSSYLKEQRVQRACTLLQQTGRTIGDISDLCGYRSTSHFTQVFKSQVKLTPFQYRARAIGELQ